MASRLASVMAYLTISIFYMATAGAINVLWLKFGFLPAFATMLVIVYVEQQWA